MEGKIYEDLDEMYEDIEDLQAEVSELRAWKEKARPLLLALNSRLVQDMEMFPDCIPDSFNTQKATLTELLGGSDERDQS